MARRCISMAKRQYFNNKYKLKAEKNFSTIAQSKYASKTKRMSNSVVFYCYRDPNDSNLISQYTNTLESSV